MERYINADQMIADTEAMKKVAGAIEIDGIVKYIEEHIYADVQEVKHAHWITVQKKDYYGEVYAYDMKCSNCKEQTDLRAFSRTEIKQFSRLKCYAYCSYCGAKMDGDKNV